MNTTTIAIIVLSVVLLFWYIGGHLYNRRHGQRLFLWLKEGLSVLGNDYQWNWLGSPASGARILIERAHPPFRQMEITLLLENREIPILWLADRLQHKRDSAIIRATLQSPGNGEIQAGMPTELRGAPILSWHQEKGPHGLLVAYQGPGASSQLAKLIPWLSRYGHQLRRLMLQPRAPHLVLWLHLTGPTLSVPASTLFTDLQAALKARTTPP